MALQLFAVPSPIAWAGWFPGAKPFKVIMMPVLQMRKLMVTEAVSQNAKSKPFTWKLRNFRPKALRGLELVDRASLVTSPFRMFPVLLLAEGTL